jgi:RHS repeat-associated protein
VSYTYTNRVRANLSLQAPNASPWVQLYAYDPAKRLKTLSSPAGSFGYTYDPQRSTLPKLLTLPNSAYITNAYDGNARLLSTVLENSTNGVLDSWTYAYNHGNQRTNVTRTDGSFVGYNYDPIGQLKTALGKESGGVTNRWHEQFGYAYDAAGNLNWRTNNALLEAFNVNNLNELTTETNSGRLTVAGTTTSPATNVTVNTSNAALYADWTFASTNQPIVNGNNTFSAIAEDSLGRRDTNSITVNLPATNTFSYDLNGNLVSDGQRGFDYDDENQLIRITATNLWKADFVYDGKMRRRIRYESTWNGSVWVTNSVTRYIYDRNLVVQERDGNNLPQISYTRGRDLSGSLHGAGGIGGVLARIDHSLSTVNSPLSIAFYHSDGNGNITTLISAAQAFVAKYLYDPFGNAISQSGLLAEANLYRFSSKEVHLTSGLYYYGYRYCVPESQRWLNRDPIGERDGQNVYRFVGNDPADHVDFLGHCKSGFSLPFEDEILGVVIREAATPSPLKGTIDCHFSKYLVKRRRCYTCTHPPRMEVHFETEETGPLVMISPGSEIHSRDEADTIEAICRPFWDSHRPPGYVPN